MHKCWRWTVAAIVMVAACTSLFVIPAAESQEPAHPKLVVMVVFDQMRGDYPKKWQPLFGDGGFKRLQTDGAWFTNCHYPYAYTLTAPGHTSLSTGTTPSQHGIIANDWYDRATAESVTSVSPPPEAKTKGVGPYRRKAESVGDVLLRVLMGKGRVASLSIKDRAAILMAALRANLCYWFNTQTGNFGTSAYYRPDPHPWVTKFNKLQFADQWLDKSWDRFDNKVDYAKYSGPDDFISEGTGYLQGQTFPHPFKLGVAKDAKKSKKNYYDAVTNSPMGNELLLQFAKTAIVSEKLGQGDTVDLLCLSFSSNDTIGHCWGPDSQEVLDVTLRSDALIKDLLDFLDAKVGKGNYYVALSADHGVCPLPEFAKGKSAYDDATKIVADAGRIEPEILTTQAEAFLNQQFLADGKKAPWFEEPRKGNPWVYLNRATLKELKLPQADVERALAGWFNKQSGIEHAFTRTELMNPRNEEAKEQHPLFESVKRSFYPSASGDVMVIIKPYHLFSPATLTKNPDKLTSYRTTHGTPHPYDTHVPLMVMGPRIVPGVRDQRVTPQTMASILAEALGVPPPTSAAYPAPPGLFKK
jgi:arylsulfatase A-like enzyme